MVLPIRSAEGEPAGIAGVAEAQGLNEGDDPPSVGDLDRGGEGGLAAGSADSVADVLKELPFGLALNVLAPQISGEGRKALADGSIAVIRLAVTLLAVEEISLLARFNDSRIFGIQRRFQGRRVRCTVEGLSALERHNTGLHDEDGILIGTHGRGFPHATVREVVVVNHEQIVDDRHNDQDRGG